MKIARRQLLALGRAQCVGVDDEHEPIGGEVGCAGRSSASKSMSHLLAHGALLFVGVRNIAGCCRCCLSQFRRARAFVCLSWRLAQVIGSNSAAISSAVNAAPPFSAPSSRLAASSALLCWSALIFSSTLPATINL